MKVFWGLVFVMGMAQICYAEFGVQVGAFTDPSNVNRTIERLQAEGYPAVTDLFTNQSGTKYQCVLAGPYSTRKEAQAVLAKLKRSGWSGFVRTYQPAAGVKPAPIPSQKITPEPAPQPTPTPEPSVPKTKTAPPTPPAVPETQPAPEIEKPAEEPAPIDLDALKAGGKRSPFSGFIQNEAAYTYADPEHGSKFK